MPQNEEHSPSRFVIEVDVNLSREQAEIWLFDLIETGYLNSRPRSQRELDGIHERFPGIRSSGTIKIIKE